MHMRCVMHVYYMFHIYIYSYIVNVHACIPRVVTTRLHSEMYDVRILYGIYDIYDIVVFYITNGHITCDSEADFHTKK